jgi:hypothetical protein
MRYQFCIAFLVLFGFMISACSESTPVLESNSNIRIEAKPAVGSSASQPGETPQQEDEKKSTAGGLLDFANKLIEKAESNSEDAKKAKEWMNDKFGSESGGESFIPEDAAQWAADAFSKLKDKGMTSAGSPSQWLKEDIRNMNALKYKIVKVSLDDLEALEDELNRMGQLKWDCFHVAEKNGETILFFKKEKRSILKNIPVRDMMKLVPLMGDN